MDADGTGRENITNSSQFSEGNPAWSPDGTQIAFDALPRFEDDPSFDVRVMNADGSDQHVVVGGPSVDGAPSWQPLPPPPAATSCSPPAGPVSGGLYQLGTHLGALGGVVRDLAHQLCAAGL